MDGLINVKMHTMCHKRFLSLLPSKYQSEDSNKLAIAYFSLASLQLLNTLETSFTVEERQKFIDFIYSHLITTDEYSGFCGSLIYNKTEESMELAATCFSLQCLLILKDNFKRIDRRKILNFVKACQLSNGGFTNGLLGKYVKDLRYVMIATTISRILVKDRSKVGEIIDIPKLYSFILQLQSYDGGFSMYPGDESHCGMVFCAVDSLFNINHINKFNHKPLLDFLTHRQIDFNTFNKPEYDWNEYADMEDIGGFNGRLNKYGDTCYVFWSLASLELLSLENIVNTEKALDFLLNKTQNFKMGGFNKTTDPDEFPDPMHSFLGLCALSILNHEQVSQLNCQFVIPQLSYEHWLTL